MNPTTMTLLWVAFLLQWCLGLAILVSSWRLLSWGLPETPEERFKEVIRLARIFVMLSIFLLIAFLRYEVFGGAPVF